MADPIALAAAAMLAPYLAKAGETVAQKAGEGAWKVAESLYQKIQGKFVKDKDEYAEKTLQRLEEQPTNATHQEALAEILDEKCQADTAFAQDLKQLVQGASQTQGMNQFLTSVYDQGQVGKIINIAQAGTLHIE